MSERAHVAAFKALIDAAIGAPAADPDRGAYDYGEAPADLPSIYCLVSLSRRFGGDVRASGTVSRKGWRLSVLCVGRTPDEARWCREKVQGALDETRVAALGSEFVKFETENEIAPDDGRFSGLTQFTYATNA